MTALTPPEHENTATVEQAAMWLADQHPEPKPIIAVIRERFGLTALQACEAAAMSQKFRIYRRAHG